MSLKGRISSESPGTIGGWTNAIANVKKAIGNITGTSIGDDADDQYPDIFVEGIVQGDIKFNAVNDWKTTLYYGFTDSLKGFNIGGELTQSSINLSSVMKFANTVMNVMGYTLGGTGPTSRKMYNGSNLNGFSVQFKWYTPHMDGWGEALQSLCVLGWPMSALNQGNTGVVTRNEPTEAEKLATEGEYKSILSSCDAHVRAIANMTAKIEQMQAIGAYDSPETVSIYNSYFKGKDFQYTDLNEVKSDIDLYIASNSSLIVPLGKLSNSKKVDDYVIVAANRRDPIQLRSNNIGSDIGGVHWYNQTTLPSNPSVPAITGDKTLAKPAKEPAVATGEVNLSKAVDDTKSAAVSFFKGLVDSFARNPPIVKLEIFDYKGTIKYSFSPLVITAFSINASRETIDGDPVILTIDVSFDYHQVNATNALEAPNQLFAGVPMFKLEER